MEGKDSSSWVIYDVYGWFMTRRVLRRGMPWRRGSCVFDVVSFFFFFFKGKNITAMIGHDWFDERSLNVCIKLLNKALERCGTLFSKCKNVERNII